jgi:hypothetical protein
MMRSLFEVGAQDLGRLTPEGGVELFRDLLWCHARRIGVPTSRIHISAQVSIADGGIDAEVDAKVPTTEDPLVAGNSFFQIKTGSTAAPWQEAWVRRELFGERGQIETGRLGAAVRRCMERGGRYILVCLGCDPTGEQIHAAIGHFQSMLSRCGYTGT